MTRRSAQINAADIERIVRAAKRGGAAEVIIETPAGRVTAKLFAQSSTVDEAPLVPKGEIVL
jgi:hypothetical protein